MHGNSMMTNMSKSSLLQLYKKSSSSSSSSKIETWSQIIGICCVTLILNKAYKLCFDTMYVIVLHWLV
jgi:hypothetical protein